MRYFLLALLCFTCITKSHAQTPTNCYGRIVVEFIKEKRPKRIYAKVDTASSSPCYDSAKIKSLEKNINESLTYRNGAKKGKYIVAVKFIVSKDGSISDVQCETDPGFGMCQAVLRAVKKSQPWLPAAANGRQARVRN
jgi:outer membrane biosynthesis protein TonB